MKRCETGRVAALAAFATLHFALATLPLLAQPSPPPGLERARTLEEVTAAARTLIDRSEYLAAEELLTRTLDSVAPADDISTLLYVLVEVNEQLDRNYPALDAARRFLLLYPDDPRAGEMLYRRGLLAWREKKRGEALASFEKMIRLKGDRADESYYWTARMAAEDGDLDRAEALADKSLEDGPHDYTDDALYLSAWIKEGRGDYVGAAELYRRLLEEYPEGDLALDAQLRLGVNQVRNGYHESALTLFTSLSPSSDRQREELLFFSAEAYAELGRHDEAIDRYRQFIRSFPGSIRIRNARYALGYSELMAGRRDEATSTFRTLTSGSDSLAAAALYQIGAIAATSGDTTAAVNALHELVRRLPYESFSDNAYYQLGRIHYRRAQWDSAVRYLTVTARQFPESDVRVEAFHLLGEAHAVRNEYNNALYAFSRTRILGDTTDPLRWRAIWREGMMLYRVGRFRSAIERLRTYVSEYPTGIEIDAALFWLAEALYQDRSYEEAERFYAEQVADHPTSRWRPQAMVGLGWARFRQKKFREAITAFEAYVKAYPDRDDVIDATIRIADSWRFLGKYDKAIATYESIGGRAGAGGRAEEARVRLAEALAEMGQTAQAVETYRNLVRDFPKSERVDDYAWAVGATWFRGGDDAAAIIELEKFLKDFERSEYRANAMYTLGEAFYNLGEYETSVAWYRRLLDEEPNAPVVSEAIEGLTFALESMGRGPEAVAIIEEFVAGNPDRLAADSVAFRKGMIFFNNGDYDRADTLFTKLLVEFPESGLQASAAYHIGKGREYRGDLDGAIAQYEMVVSRFPTASATASALVDMAELKMYRKNYAGARANFERAIDGFGESILTSQARYGAGRAAVMLGDTVQAIERFRFMIDSVSGIGTDIFVDRSRVSLAEILYARDSVDQALELLASVTARRRDSPAAEALLMRGRILVEINDLSAALADLRRLVDEFEVYTDFVEPGLYELGLLYEKLTDTGAAIRTYEALIERTEDESLRKKANERVKALGGGA